MGRPSWSTLVLESTGAASRRSAAGDEVGIAPATTRAVAAAARIIRGSHAAKRARARTRSREGGTQRTSGRAGDAATTGHALHQSEPGRRVSRETDPAPWHAN